MGQKSARDADELLRKIVRQKRHAAVFPDGILDDSGRAVDDIDVQPAAVFGAVFRGGRIIDDNAAGDVLGRDEGDAGQVLRYVDIISGAGRYV